MKNRLSLLALLLVLSSCIAHGQAGNTGLAFLKLGAGGRALGMGEAFTSLATDPSATYYNPSGLSYSGGPQLLIMHKEWIEDSRTEFLAATTRLDKVALGLSVNGTSVSNIELRNIPGPPLETFTARNAAVGVSAAYAIDTTLSVGATAKYLYEKILAEEASGYGVDLGATYVSPWDIRIGAVLANLGSMNELVNEATKLPESFRIGASYKYLLPSLDATLTGAADYVTYSGEDLSHVLLGAEFDYHHTFAARAGYQTSYDSKGFSAGVGIHYQILRFDYAYVPFKYDFGSTHTLSLTLEFE